MKTALIHVKIEALTPKGEEAFKDLPTIIDELNVVDSDDAKITANYEIIDL